MSPRQSRFIARLGFVAALVSAHACSDVGAPSQSSTPPDRVSLQRPGVSSALLAAEATQRIAAAKERSVHIGKLHHDAMQDLLTNLPTNGAASRGKAERCQAAAELTLRRMPMIEAAFNVSWTQGQRRQLVRDAFRAIGPCKSQHPMNLFDSRDEAASPITTAMMDDPPGTEAVIGPINDLIAAVLNSDGTVAGVASITAASLANNSSLGSVDLEILAGVASLANSSAAEWNAYSAQGGFGAEIFEGEWDWGGGGGSGAPAGCPNWPGACQEYQTSIFFESFGFWRKAGLVAGSDVIGCGTAALATWWSGAAGAGAACVIWGIGTSAGSLLGVVLM